MLKKLRVATWKMSNKSFCKVIFLQRDHQGFLKDLEVRFIDKSQASDPTKRERTLATLYPDGRNIESDY